MHILRRFNRMPARFRGGAFAIGNFDGVHRGHQEVISSAKRSGASPVGVLMFAPHPWRYFRPDAPLAQLSCLRAKLCLLRRSGVDVAVVAPFDSRMANRSAAEFVEEVLVEQLAVSHVSVGYDFAFGRKREGDAARLRALAGEAGIGVEIVAPVLSGNEACSSTRIRAALRQGDLTAAAEMLGHWWGTSGRVIPGDRRGHSLGLPTANLPLVVPGEEFLLPFGIYAAWALLEEGHGGICHPAAVNIGWRPSFRTPRPLLEAHLLDFEGDLYGRRLWVFPVAFLRKEKKFDDIGSLCKQMQADCREARRLIGRIGNPPRL